MHMMKVISAAVVLSATIAGPVFAQDVEYGPAAGAAPYVAHGPGSRAQTFYRSYDRAPGDYLPGDIDQHRNLQNFGFSGRDPSRVGGQSPNLTPPGN
jgi:hypothetical protein